MKVKTNFKKMFLVDNLPTHNKSKNDDNIILNKYIDTQDTDNDN